MTTLTQTESTIATAQIADACMRLKIPFSVAPPGIKAIVPLDKLVFGPVIPVRHYGSVDVFLEVLEGSAKNGVLVIDNGGRLDEACIGDLTVLEVKQAGLQAIVLWGLHRDTRELVDIGLPVFSYGAYPAGPSRLDSRDPEALTSARFGQFVLTAKDTAFVDRDGVVFIETVHVDQVVNVARTIRETERKQVQAAMQGVSLREQFQFQSFLKQRQANHDYTFRKHLSSLSRSIEE